MSSSGSISRVLEVLAGVIILAAGLWALYQCWQVAEYQWCRWRLDKMSRHVLSTDEMSEDLDVLLEALVENHPAPFEHISKTELYNRFNTVRDVVRHGLTRSEFFALAAPVVASIGCGHTALRPPRGWIGLLARGGRVLPLGIRFVDGRAFVVEDYGAHQEVPLGTEVLAINDRTIAQIRAELLTALSADGPGRAFALAQLNDYFFFLHAKFIGPARSYRLKFLAPGEVASKTVSITGVLAKDVADVYWEQHPVRDVRSSVFPVHVEVFEDQRAAYLWVPTFDVGKARGFKTVLRDFFEEIQNEDIQTLVIDVRSNNGGPSVIAVELVKYLIPREFRFLRLPGDAQSADLSVFKHYAGTLHPFADVVFSGDLYVLTDGGSFSTTGHFCAALEANREVIFVGEKTGGGYRCHDNGTLVELPNSRLALRVATTTFEVDVAGGTRFISPDLQIAPTVEDLVTGRDAVLAELGSQLGLDLESAALRLAVKVKEFPEGV